MSGCPHIIFYRVNPVTASIVKRKLLLPYVGLPNVFAGRFVVAEFLQGEATAANLARAALNLYDDTVTRRRLEALFAGMAKHTSPPIPRRWRPMPSRRNCAHGGHRVLIAGAPTKRQGPLAGPVVAAAVILHPSDASRDLRDSKLLTPRGASASGRSKSTCMP